MGDRIELLAVACQFEQRQGVSPCQACLNTAGILHAPCFLQFDLPVIKEGEAASTPRMTCAPVSRGVPAMQGRRLNIQQGLWPLCPTKRSDERRVGKECVSTC